MYIPLMRTCHFLIAFCLSTCIVNAQNEDNSLNLVPHFSAILVSDMGSSRDWYTQALGYEVRSENKIEGRFEIVNMQRGTAALELIELASAESPKSVIPNFTAKTRLHGIFKIGYEVQDLDPWIDHLRKLQVQFQGEVVQDPNTNRRMVIILDPDGNRIQLFEQ